MKKYLTLVFVLVLMLTSCNSVVKNTENTTKATVETTTETKKGFSSFSFYKPENESRYAAYKQAKNLDDETTVTYVNIGLDNPFYTNIVPVKNPSDILVLTNKYNQLPSDYTPDDLMDIDNKYTQRSGQKIRKEAYDAYMKMVNENPDYDFCVRSSFRSYDFQVDVYNSIVDANGKEAADKKSARPGHSEHQTGLTMDLIDRDNSSLDETFENTKEFAFLKDNAHKYGFIIRYPKDKQDITGFSYEPWHYRYVGVDVATGIYNESITFDEYMARKQKKFSA